MNGRMLQQLWQEHPYQCLYGLLGLLIGLSLVALGILQTLVLCLCVVVGLAVGERADNRRTAWRESHGDWVDGRADTAASDPEAGTADPVESEPDGAKPEPER